MTERPSLGCYPEELHLGVQDIDWWTPPYLRVLGWEHVEGGVVGPLLARGGLLPGGEGAPVETAHGS